MNCLRTSTLANAVENSEQKTHALGVNMHIRVLHWRFLRRLLC